MSTFVLIPGAGGAAWYWHRVVPRLTAAGHTAIAVDLPGASPTAGLREYEAFVAAAAAGEERVVLVAQSMGAFTALGCCDRLPVERLVLLNAMIPAPGETPGQWWSNTDWPEVDDLGDIDTLFLHDVPPEVAAAGAAHQRPEADVAFGQPCGFAQWPRIPTAVLVGRDDRLFPPSFQARVARERLGLDVTLVPGGHLAALSRPEAVAEAILAPTAWTSWSAP